TLRPQRLVLRRYSCDKGKTIILPRQRCIEPRQKKTRTRRVFSSAREGVLESGSGQLVEALGDDGDAFFQLRVGNGDGHQEADDVVVGAARQQDQALLARTGDDLAYQLGSRLAVVTAFEQLDGDHRTQAAHVTDHLVLLGDLVQAAFQLLADSVGTLQQLLLVEHLEHGQGRGAGKRAAGVGAAQAAGSDGVHDLRLAAHTGDREAATNGLGEGGQIRNDAQLLGGEEGTGTAGAGLYFVSDEHDAVLVAQRAQALHERLGVDVEATLALYRLDDDRGDVAGLRIVLEDALDAGDGLVFADAVQRARRQGAEDATRHQAHAGGVRHDLAGQTQGHHGAAVIGAGEGDHAGTASGGAGDLHGVFDGFGAGGDQQ